MDQVHGLARGQPACFPTPVPAPAPRLGGRTLPALGRRRPRQARAAWLRAFHSVPASQILPKSISGTGTECPMPVLPVPGGCSRQGRVGAGWEPGWAQEGCTGWGGLPLLPTSSPCRCSSQQPTLSKQLPEAVLKAPHRLGHKSREKPPGKKPSAACLRARHPPPRLFAGVTSSPPSASPPTGETR